MPGTEPGIRRLVPRPEALTPEAGRQQASAGERDTPVEVERAAARVHAVLSYRAVTRATTSMTSSSPQPMRGAHLATEAVGPHVIVPFGAACLLTGLVRSPGPVRGLLRHYG